MVEVGAEFAASSCIYRDMALHVSGFLMCSAVAPSSHTIASRLCPVWSRIARMFSRWRTYKARNESRICFVSQECWKLSMP